MASGSFDGPTGVPSGLSHFVRCSICLDSYKEPRTLPCLHTFCTCCLQQHMETTMLSNIPGITYFRCPSCREDFLLPMDGIMGFRRDFRVEQVRELLGKKQETEIKDTVNINYDLCGICKEESGECFCQECNVVLCSNCERKHVTVEAFASHNLKKKISDGCDLMGSKCEMHETEMAKYICQDCSQAVCNICILQFHSDHSILNHTSGANDILERLDFHLKALASRKSHLRSKVTDILVAENEIRSCQTFVAKNIKSRVDEIITEIYKQESRLLSELHDRCSEEIDHLDHNRQLLQHTLDDMDNISEVTQWTPTRNVNILLQYDRQVGKIAALLDDTMMHNVDPFHLNIDFSPSRTKSRLGKLIFTTSLIAPAMMMDPDRQIIRNEKQNVESNMFPSTWNSVLHDSFEDIGVASGGAWNAEAKLTMKLGKTGSSGGEFNMPRDACFLPDGDFAVADTNNDRIQVFNSRGLLVTVIGQGHIRPWGITRTQEGFLAVTDNLDKSVKLYDVGSGRLLKQFGSFLCPCGISVNSKGKFLVTDFFSTFVHILNKDGSTHRQFQYRTSLDKHACGASRIEVTSTDDIIISDVSNACLKAFDKKGRYLWSMPSLTELLSPQGLCITQSGLLLVADAIHNKICIFTTSGSFLGDLQTPSHRLQEPSGLTISPDNKTLLLTRMRANQIRLYRIMIPHLTDASSTSSSSSD